jgi:hypothetical protein
MESLDIGCFEIPDLDIVFADKSFNSGGCLWQWPPDTIHTMTWQVSPVTQSHASAVCAGAKRTKNGWWRRTRARSVSRLLWKLWNSVAWGGILLDPDWFRWRDCPAVPRPGWQKQSSVDSSRWIGIVTCTTQGLFVSGVDSFDKSYRYHLCLPSDVNLSTLSYSDTFLT